MFLIKTLAFNNLLIGSSSSVGKVIAGLRTLSNAQDTKLVSIVSFNRCP